MAYSAPQKKQQQKRAASQKSSGSSKGKTSKSSSSGGTSLGSAQEVDVVVEEISIAPAADYESAPAPASAPAPVMAAAPAPAHKPAVTAPAAPITPLEVADVPTDSQWDAFRKCMATTCEGSDFGSPPNVQCYKENRFDEAVAGCEYTIAAHKKDTYKRYFWDEFLVKEMTSACKEKEGEFNPDVRRCRIVITFKRHEPEGKDMFGKKVSGTGCPNQSAQKPAFLGDKPFPCSHETFGLGECRAVDQSVQTQKDMAMMTGIISTATAAIGATVAVVGSASNAKANKLALEDLETKQNKIKQDERFQSIGDTPTGSLTPNQNTLKADYEANQKKIEALQASGGAGKGAAIGAAWEAGGSGLTQGVTQFAMAGIMDSTGGIVLGRCIVPSGEEVKEGSYIQLNW